ncbi:hypothetical protein [Bacillus sp. 1NLA3E]|nr:hypothetical protein [Bacillus sp. 1NLA3E]
MSKNYFLTPEEIMRKRKMNKKLLYASFIIFTIILSTFVTILTNQML